MASKEKNREQPAFDDRERKIRFWLWAARQFLLLLLLAIWVAWMMVLFVFAMLLLIHGAFSPSDVGRMLKGPI